jgi:CDP-diacylglycerol---serine O-phosphatidyltransferase
METRRDTRSTHFSMLRSYRAADLLSLGNAASGTAAIFAIMSYLEQPDRWRVYLALGLLPLALALDIADGRVASFGVAPAALAYALGMRGGLDVAILLFFVACGISRLARYNVTAAEIAAAGEKVKHFEGTPIPSSLILILILALCFHWRRVDADLPFGVIKIISFDWHPLSLMYLLSGAGMISKTLRIPKL